MKDSRVVLINDKDIENIKGIIKNTKQELTHLDKEIQIIEQRKTESGFKKCIHAIKKIIIQIDIKAGINLLKVIFWLGMAGTIIFFSADINAKLIGAITYFLGITMDMLLLRKHLPQIGMTFIRLCSGLAAVIFMGIMVILILALMASALSISICQNLFDYINWALFICGFISTVLELANSISEDD